MLIDVVEVKPLSDYRLFLRFEDGLSGEIDISEVIEFKGIFAKLSDKSYFSRVKVNPEIGTICWENGADLAPEFLHENIKATDIDENDGWKNTSEKPLVNKRITIKYENSKGETVYTSAHYGSDNKWYDESSGLELDPKLILGWQALSKK